MEVETVPMEVVTTPGCLGRATAGAMENLAHRAC
jgi:hypothetical protein